MTNIKLDPRPARILTSREAAKLIGALFGYELGSVIGTAFGAQNLTLSQEQVVQVSQRSLEIAHEMFRNPTSHFDLIKRYATTELDAVRIAGPIAAMLTDIQIVGNAEAEVALSWWTQSRNGRETLEALVARIYGTFLARRDVLREGIAEVKGKLA